MNINSQRKYALIVAGGNGKRMESGIPKQFLSLNGKPVLMHTIEAFNQITDIEIIVVLPSSEFERWKTLCIQYSFHPGHVIVEGGETRFHSVRNGLEKVGEGIVAIHDGVRPVISGEIIEQSFIVATQYGNAVAAIKPKDSIREITQTGFTKSVNRDKYYLVQTPQTFQSALIKESYQKATHHHFSDDAEVLEEISGHTINLIEGDYRNIKITTPEDLILASAFLNSKTDLQNF